MSRRHRVFVLALPLLMSGCSILGETTNMIVQLLNVAISLALAAAPFALGYYLYKKDDD